MEKSDTKRLRAQEILKRKNSNLYGYKFMGLSEGNVSSRGIAFQTVYRSMEWEKVIHVNYIHSKRP
jgi:hypothetical protein